MSLIGWKPADICERGENVLANVDPVRREPLPVAAAQGALAISR